MSGTLVDTLVTGLPLVPLVLGIYLVLRIREDFDLTVEGSFTIGGAVAAALLAHGKPVPVALALAIMAGAGAGLITTAVHIGLGVPVILAGLVTSIGLYSVDLRVMETPSIALTSATTLFSGFDGLSPAARDWAVIGVLGLVAVVVLIGVGLFLRTEIGLALRVSGANTRLVRSQGVNERFLIALNLVLANSLCGLSGALLVQGQGFADVNMGAGVLVAGLGALLLGELVTRPSGSRILRGLAAVLIGAVLYRLVLTLAINAGLPPTDLKLATALTLIAAFALQRAISWTGNRRRARLPGRRTPALVEGPGQVYEKGRVGA